MPILNMDVADIFNETAGLLEMEGDNQIGIRNYRNAA
jgi:DNA polymerase/3'-5' exonuclease PolX